MRFLPKLFCNQLLHMRKSVFLLNQSTVAKPAVIQIMQCMTKNFPKMFKNQFSIIVHNRIILYLCTSTPEYCIYYFVYPNQWFLGDIFAKYSRTLLILALLPWHLSGPAYFHMHDWKTIAYDCCVVCLLCVLVMHFQNFMTSYIILY